MSQWYKTPSSKTLSANAGTAKILLKAAAQIQHKLGHGIRAISPVLLGVEREEDWRKHFEGVCKSLAPGNEFELDLAYLIAWQLWRFGRLVRHETALTT